MNITRQDVLRAFWQFDQKKMPIVNVNGSFTSTMNIKLRQELCEEWLNAFDGIDVDTWNKVIALAIKECKVYPSYDKMFEFIERVSCADCVLPDIVPAEPPAPAKKKTAGRKQNLSKMFELAKSGNFSEARSFCIADVTAAEVEAYVKRQWPDGSDKILQNCISEVTEVLRQEHTCSECKGVKKCRTFGYRTIGYIDKYSGCLCTRMVECRERRKERQEQEC